MQFFPSAASRSARDRTTVAVAVRKLRPANAAETISGNDLAKAKRVGELLGLVAKAQMCARQSNYDAQDEKLPARAGSIDFVLEGRWDVRGQSTNNGMRISPVSLAQNRFASALPCRNRPASSAPAPLPHRFVIP